MDAHEVHACEIHACEVYAYKTPTYEMWGVHLTGVYLMDVQLIGVTVGKDRVTCGNLSTSCHNPRHSYPLLSTDQHALFSPLGPPPRALIDAGERPR
jgi:hypothetical protein